jgi:predicted TIM-barrel fold metal-dependent hydrolase
MSEARVHDVPVIDACAFHDWTSNADLIPYLRDGWDELVRFESLKIKSMWQNQHPLGDTDPALRPASGAPAGSDPALLIEHLLEQRGSERVVLGHQEGLLSAGLPLSYEARAVVRALNDWTAKEWLERDSRLYGHILIASGMPEEAVAEIKRVGENDRFVAVALGANGLNRPFGHPAYHPIYQAAADLGLPVVVQVGADNVADLGTSPTAVGLNTTYTEYTAMAAAPLMSHITSFFTGGVFDLFPTLKILVVGGGLAWIPQYVWRLDWNYKMVRRVEVPWSKRMPSEYLTEHVRWTTYSMETPRRQDQLDTVLELIPSVEETLVYASGYPYADGLAAADVAARIPKAIHQRVFADNARDFYRWPESSRPASTQAATSVTSAEVA